MLGSGPGRRPAIVGLAWLWPSGPLGPLGRAAAANSWPHIYRLGWQPGRQPGGGRSGGPGRRPTIVGLAWLWPVGALGASGPGPWAMASTWNLHMTIIDSVYDFHPDILITNYHQYAVKSVYDGPE